MTSQRVKVGAVLLVILLVTAGVALAANGYALPRHVIGGGGGRAASANYILEATIGQAVAGQVSGATYALCAGFWCGAGGEEPPHQIYLPLVIRS